MPEKTPGYAAALAAAEHQQYVQDLACQLAHRHPALLTPQLRIPLLRTQLALLIHHISPENAHGH